MNSFVKQGKNESVFLHVAGLVLIIKQYVELLRLCEGFRGPNSTLPMNSDEYLSIHTQADWQDINCRGQCDLLEKCSMLVVHDPSL